MPVMIFWKSEGKGKAKKAGVMDGALWDQFLVNAKAGYGLAYFVECNSAQEGRDIIESGVCRPTPHINVYAHGTDRLG